MAKHMFWRDLGELIDRSYKASNRFQDDWRVRGTFWVASGLGAILGPLLPWGPLTLKIAFGFLTGSGLGMVVGVVRVFGDQRDTIAKLTEKRFTFDVESSGTGANLIVRHSHGKKLALHIQLASGNLNNPAASFPLTVGTPTKESYSNGPSVSFEVARLAGNPAGGQELVISVPGTGMWFEAGTKAKARYEALSDQIQPEGVDVEMWIDEKRLMIQKID